VVGPRCPDHSPAALAGRLEPDVQRNAPHIPPSAARSPPYAVQPCAICGEEMLVILVGQTCHPVCDPDGDST
jgi:hypothetical protein